ncbi:hypothetical protein Tco_0606632 [Tanacetum coccineum]
MNVIDKASHFQCEDVIDKASRFELWVTKRNGSAKSLFRQIARSEEIWAAVRLLVASCFAIFDIEPLTLSLDFVLIYEIFKSLSFCLDRLCRLAILYLDQHTHTLHHLESLLTISLDILDILKEDLFEHERVVVNPTPAGMRHHHLHLYMNPEIKWLAIKQIQRISLTGFPAQSVRSSNADALDSPYLLVLNIGMSQSRQHDMSESNSYYLSD